MAKTLCQLAVALLLCVLRRGLAVFVGGFWVGAGAQQQIGHYGMPIVRGLVERRVSVVVVHRVHVGIGIHKLGCNGIFALQGGIVERGAAVAVHSLYLCLTTQSHQKRLECKNETR